MMIKEFLGYGSRDPYITPCLQGVICQLPGPLPHPTHPAGLRWVIPYPIGVERVEGKVVVGREVDSRELP